MAKEQEMIPYEIINLATNGDTESLHYVLKYFDNYLNKLSKRKIFNEQTRKTYTYIDENVKRHLQIKLMLSVLEFKIRA